MSVCLSIMHGTKVVFWCTLSWYGYDLGGGEEGGEGGGRETALGHA